MYRYETHFHTAETSACASASAEKQVQFYKSRGFTGVFVTDHFFNGNTCVPHSLPWDERVERFCLGYENAKHYGDEYGLDVFFGWEYSYKGADLLTYGLDKEWLIAHPMVLEMDVNSYCDFVASEGGMIIHAHPFREASYITAIRLFPRKCTGVEIINANNSNEQNIIAGYYAKHYSLMPTAGSDNHSGEQERLCGIETNERITDSQHFIKLIKSAGYRIFDTSRE